MKVLEEYDLGNIPKNKEIFESFLVADNKIKSYKKIISSISGGADSDIMLDLLCRIDKDKIIFFFIDTGLEYKATKDHLKYLEDKYGIKITWIKPKKPIPTACKEYGQPFLSKQVSEWIERLQRHNFKWENESFEVLYKRYPKCKTSLRWWCNAWGDKSQFNIERNKGLKEFMILYPPKHKISNKCCKCSKKDPIYDFLEENDIDLNCYGVRKSEGGARNNAYKNCFSNNEEKGKTDEYRPLFWYKDETKLIYQDFFKIKHSECYTRYGLKRTGCAGCPYGRDFEGELEVIKNYEPKLYKAVNNIFKDSYEYTRAYKKFVKEKFKNNDEEIEGQISLFDQIDYVAI